MILFMYFLNKLTGIFMQIIIINSDHGSIIGVVDSVTGERIPKKKAVNKYKIINIIFRYIVKVD